MEQHVSNTKTLLMGLESVKKILQIDAQVEPHLSNPPAFKYQCSTLSFSLILGTYFAYYYLYRHRAQQTCQVACDCGAINLKNNVQSSAYFRKDVPLSKPVVSEDVVEVQSRPKDWWRSELMRTDGEDFVYCGFGALG